MGGHVNGGVAFEGVFAPPKNSGSLQKMGGSRQFLVGMTRKRDPYLILSVEIDASPSVERNISEGTGFVPTPREHRQGHGDRNVNSDLSHVDLPLEFSSSSAGLSEDGGSVTILVLVDDLESLIESLGVEDDEDRSEDLFMIAFHRGIGFNDSGTDEVSVRISFYRDITPIQEDLSALRLGGSDKSNDAVFGGGRGDRAPVDDYMSNESESKRKRRTGQC